jgi:hypothetical protein
MTEEWRKIPGYPDYLEVSNLGRVRSWSTAGPKRELPYFKKISSAKSGPSSASGRVQIFIEYRNGKKYMRFARVGRLVLLAFVGPPPRNTECCHKDDDPLNNSIDNIYWGTRRENITDAQRNGKMPISYRVRYKGYRKIHPAWIPAIFRLRQGGITLQAIADIFEVHISQISRIINKKIHTEYKARLIGIAADEARLAAKRAFFEGGIK